MPAEDFRANLRYTLRKGRTVLGPYWAVFVDGKLSHFETAGGAMVIGHDGRFAPGDREDFPKPEGHEDLLEMLFPEKASKGTES